MDDRIVNIRALAAIMVVIVHCAAQEFAVLTPSWWIIDIIASAVRPCVPLFFMISGYLLLDKDIGSADFISKRIGRVLYPALFWSVFYAFFIAAYNKRLPSPDEIFNALITPSMYHLWYLFFAVGIYMTIPLLTPWFRSSSKMDRWLYFIIFSSCMSASLTKVGSQIINEYYGMMFVSYFYFFIIGAMFKKGDFDWIVKRKSISIIAYIAITLFISYLTYQDSVAIGTGSQLYFTYTSPLVIIQSISIFTFMFSLRFKSIVLDAISSNSLGLYGAHVAMIIILAPIVRYVENDLLRFAIMLVSVIASTILIVSALRNIKILRNIM